MGNRIGRAVRRPALALLVVAGLMGATSAAQAALLGRDLNGSPATFEAYYDDVLKITWLADANYAKTSGFDSDGLMTWSAANTWAATTIYGITGWRLPYASVAKTVGPAAITDVVDCASATEAVCRDNEMGYMFYHDLGGVFGTSIGTTHNSNYNLFANIQNSFYWSGTEFSSTLAWRFGFDDGSEVSVRDNKISLDFAWAVHPGDVGAAAPEPASLLLMGAGMLGLGWSRRSGRRR